MNLRRRFVLIIAAILVFACRAADAAEPLVVEADFEGGSVRTIEIDDVARRIDFMPGGSPERGWPCWWFFRVKGITPGESISLRLRASSTTVDRPGAPLSKPLSPVWAQVDRATYSTDGETWHRTEKGVRQGEWMVYILRPEASSIFVAWGPPYTPSMAVKFVAKQAGAGRGATAKELCRSRENRIVPLLHVMEGDLPKQRRFGVWIQARQHAWESGSSWVAQGFGEWLMSDAADASWLRRNAEIFIVPIMDVDNAATGNGGKDAVPQDHNRDWSEKPNWNEVLAAQRMIGNLTATGRMDLFLDLHNPGPTDPTFFFTLPDDLLTAQRIESRDRFIATACSRLAVLKPKFAVNDKPKAAGSKYTEKWREMSANWVALHGNSRTVSLCLETSWHHPSGTAEVYRAVGAEVAAAVREYLYERREREKN
ncbi:MAG: zinc carboxypeptidase [Planctomycetia bacterium]|nr:zinc carboxypeptidase [Planctomycetia bacterium]